jgi:hypothetical protein
MIRSKPTLPVATTNLHGTPRNGPIGNCRELPPPLENPSVNVRGILWKSPLIPEELVEVTVGFDVAQSKRSSQHNGSAL